jgi:hypothetical protein
LPRAMTIRSTSYSDRRSFARARSAARSLRRTAVASGTSEAIWRAARRASATVSS